ncbi:hypothetical protein STTU_p0077 (plasmid) [Streptomyces sp. Tu6071]|nr:hypothetical protein STTU_p0077 [Streptomyces sp. Tu6071]
MRGVDARRAEPEAPGLGRSPRARGRPPPSLRPRGGDRRIPAGAGPTGADSADRYGLSGGSPRSRGRRADAPPRGVQPRRIPACAGPTGGACDDCP